MARRGSLRPRRLSLSGIDSRKSKVNRIHTDQITCCFYVLGCKEFHNTLYVFIFMRQGVHLCQHIHDGQKKNNLLQYTSTLANHAPKASFPELTEGVFGTIMAMKQVGR